MVFDLDFALSNLHFCKHLCTFFAPGKTRTHQSSYLPMATRIFAIG
ncbi:unnamed protein product [Acidithrix sp. C25]|nr:unnamed protein product [Acidithrix sp. C25]